MIYDLSSQKERNKYAMSMEERLAETTQTIEGYEVKNLKYNMRDDIIIGQVKDPIVGRPELHDGFVTVQWRRNGTATNKWKGRDDLKITLIY